MGMGMYNMSLSLSWASKTGKTNAIHKALSIKKANTPLSLMSFSDTCSLCLAGAKPVLLYWFSINFSTSTPFSNCFWYAQEEQKAGFDTIKLKWMTYGGQKEYYSHNDQEKYCRSFPRAVHYTHYGSHNYNHHQN
ncbi:hypothetical protein BpHYR1_054621 [Brachionus plicatilis]|uniref:Uncharacterized protein n=1 Tax=Brachionus plicatilis TaxID=10195 RepID=A0A3M7QYJ7_BRAPC|nr:hypothetical protein BpHYR1_054621 [Brachionus plicatilis]